MDVFSLPTKELKLAARAIEKEARRYSDVLRRIDVPKAYAGRPGAPVEVWRSCYFLVQVYTHEGATRISVNRTAVDTDNRRWKDGITWDALQKVKREIGRGDAVAVEVYPPDADVVDVANIRHLWLVGEGALPFIWRNKH